MVSQRNEKTILNASKNATFTIKPYPRLNALLSHFSNRKHDYIVAISRQCLFGADKAVQMSRSVFFDKGTQPELCAKKGNRPIIRISDLLFWVLTF